MNTTGNNTDGLTLATAWTSLSKVNAQTFQAGDRVLFEGGKTFTGNIELDALDGNIALQPLVLSTYGSGRATISTTVTTKCGLKATNLQGVHIKNLIFLAILKIGISLTSSVFESIAKGMYFFGKHQSDLID